MAQVAVVGGGPSGLIAAETLVANGVNVTVYEHRRSVGRKFLLAGRSGLNITHAEPLGQLLSRYGNDRAHLEAAINAFTPENLRAWCLDHGEPTFVGTSDRVFPESFRATPLLREWLTRLTSNGVQFEVDHRWAGWNDDGALAFDVGGEHRTVTPAATVFALGGASWPRVGSDGAWVAEFERTGIAVHELVAANCGIEVPWSSAMLKRQEGKPIKNAVFTSSGRSVRGDAVVTKRGLEGGPIYALGPELRASVVAVDSSPLVLDTQPDLTHERLTEKLSNRRPKSSATSWLNSAGVAPMTVDLAREATNNLLPESATAFASLLKQLPVNATGMEPLDRAISTAGGVGFDQVDDNWMLTAKPGNFVAGEMLDWEAPTGGYLLQACFSTGVAAANGVLRWIAEQAEN